VTTNADSQGLRSFTIVVLTVSTIAMLALSMLTNATFGYRFGTTAVTAAVFAAANVIADIWKGLGLIVVAGLLRERHRSVAALLAVLWIVALSFGVASSMGVYVQDRTAMVGGREALQANLRDVERELGEATGSAASSAPRSRSSRTCRRSCATRTTRLLFSAAAARSARSSAIRWQSSVVLASTRVHRADTDAATPAPLSLETARIEHHPVGSVVDFVAEGTVPAPETSAIGSDELYDGYLRWCRGRRRDALGGEPFSAEFDRLRELPALRGKVRKFGSRYFGNCACSIAV